MTDQQNPLLRSAAPLLSLLPAALLLTEFNLPASPDVRGGAKTGLEALDSLRVPIGSYSIPQPAPQKRDFPAQVQEALTNRLENRILVNEQIARIRPLVTEIRQRTAISYCIVAQANPDSARQIDKLDLLFRFTPPTADLLTLDNKPRERPLTSDLFVDRGDDGTRRAFIVTIPANLSRPQGELTAHIAKQVLTALEWNRYLDTQTEAADKGLKDGRPPQLIINAADQSVSADLERMSETFRKTAADLAKQKPAAGSLDAAGNAFFAAFSESFAATVERQRPPGPGSPR